MDGSAGAFPGVFLLTQMWAVAGDRSHVCGQCVGVPWRMDAVMIKDEDLSEEDGQKEEVRERMLDYLLKCFRSPVLFFPNKESQA